MTRKGFLIALVLLLALPLAASGDGTVTIDPGTLLATLEDFVFPNATYSFVDQTRSVSGVLGTVSDFRGTTDGWKIDILAADFNGTPGGWPVTVVSQNLTILLYQTDLARISGDPSINPLMLPIGADAPLDNTTPLALFNCAVGCEPGDFTWTPRFTVTIPGGSGPGSYVSIVTVTAIAGP